MLSHDRTPCTPGAGQNPPVLSGRSHELTGFEVTLTRLATGRSAQCQLVVGVRGVGKTVLLNQFARRATERGWVVVDHELRPSGDLFAAAEPLGALVTALHEVAQRELPVTMVAAGLPQTRGVLAEAAEEEGVSWSEGALDAVVRFTEGCPFFLQLFGDLLWQHAGASPFTAQDVARTAPLVRSALDNGFLVFRTERLPLAQRRYL